jgi:3-hydroxyacyl-CoA dehydrogenase
MHVTVWDPRAEAADLVRRYVADAWPAMARPGMTADVSPDAWRGLRHRRGSRGDARGYGAGILDVRSDLEVVGGRETSPETIAGCLNFYRHIGKRPIHIRKEAPGHLANRLQAALWQEAVNAVVSGLASVEDVDTAISAGPGLRWAVMGPHMTFHLGGGEGGITHMLEQFKPAIEAWWESMTTPELSEKTCRKIIDGVVGEARGRTIAELVRERDELLIPLLELMAKRQQ